MKQHTTLTGRHRRQEAELGTMDRWETMWSKRQNVTAGRVMSPRAETSFYTLVQQHQATCLYGTDVTLNCSPQEASILIILQSALSGVHTKHIRQNKLSHCNTVIYVPEYDTDRQTETYWYSWEFSHPQHTPRTQPWLRLRGIGGCIIRQHYNNIHIIQAGEFSTLSGLAWDPRVTR